jgi:hypothetical protein
MIVEQQTSLLDLADAGLKAAIAEVAADYQGDPNLEHLIPPAVREALEPHWRALTDNPPAPHRRLPRRSPVGAEDGPQPEVLLFQIASDEAMHWMWGDAGAISSSSRRAILPQDASTRPKSASNNPDRHGLGGGAASLSSIASASSRRALSSAEGAAAGLVLTRRRAT